ncbi:MAG: flagellar filament capping protein FliD, partial [Synergistaceae bacterium]|nr:flagellar filament capping protein FliD [Synergistaceae bacterium]
ANYTVSLVHKADSSNLSGVSSCINEANGNYSNLTITDNNGKTYTYVADTADLTDDTFTIVDGLVTFKTAVAPERPTDDYTLKYTACGGESLTTEGVTRSASDTLSVDYADLDSGTVTITQGSKTFYEGVDFTLSSTGDDDSGNAVVDWIPDSKDGYEWFYPNPGSTYTINHTDEDGNTTTYSATRNSSSTLDMSTYGMTIATGSVSVQYGDDTRYYNLNAPDSGLGDGRTVISGTYSVDITPTTGSSFNFRWLTPTQTTHSNLPSMNEGLTVEFGYDANTFDLSDDGDGDLLQALGFVDSSGSYIDYTAADDAELEIDGQTVTVDSNDIGADYENEVIKGVTLHLKGTGTVSLDISHDAEKAVESIQTFVDNYNDLMTWINTRMSEKQVDEDTAATIDSDDFRMRWGLLHGNSLLRNTKSQMRSLVSQNFTFSFTERKSSSEVYGRMSYNGLKSSSTLRLRIGSKYVDVTIDPDDTLETIVTKINDDTKNGPMHNIYYDDDGNKLQTPLLKASVQNDKLVINSTSSDEITMSGSAAMNALKMNYTYKGLYQIGIETTSDDYGKSGELVFDSDEFMTALEDNPDEVQSLMLAFANQFNTWTRSMLNSSSSGEVSGTLTREIENIQT